MNAKNNEVCSGYLKPTKTACVILWMLLKYAIECVYKM